MREKEDVLVRGIVGLLAITVHDGVESGRDDERGGGDGHERGHGGRDCLIEAAFALSDASGEEAASEHLQSVRNKLGRCVCDATYEKNVGQNAAEHAGLDNSDFALLERNNRDLGGLALTSAHCVGAHLQ